MSVFFYGIGLVGEQKTLAVFFKYDVNIPMCARVFPPECD